MSKHETPLTRRFWAEVGGTLVEEFLAVPGGPDRGRRLLDGLILPDGPHEVRSYQEVDIKGQDVIVVQTKASRIGMYLLGQALFSARLMERFCPRSIRTVAICTKGDAALEPLAREYGVEVVILWCTLTTRSSRRRRRWGRPRPIQRKAEIREGESERVSSIRFTLQADIAIL